MLPAGAFQQAAGETDLELAPSLSSAYSVELKRFGLAQMQLS